YSAGQPPHRLSRAPPSRGRGTSILPGPVRPHNRRALPMDPIADVPAWLLRPLPVNAGVDPAAHDQIDRLARDVPSTLIPLANVLRRLRPFWEYDAAANRASAYVWRALDQILASPSAHVRADLLAFARDHMVPRAQARVYRRLAKDPAPRVRRLAVRTV